jgi:endonuclease YncB( thermonuclease family)
VYEINAPELKPRLKVTDRVQVIRKAKAARLALEGLIEGKMCEVNMHGMDNFGRVLAEVFVESKNIGHTMLDSGNAIPFYPNHSKHEQLGHEITVVPKQPVAPVTTPSQSSSTTTRSIL